MLSSINITGGRRSIADDACGATLGGTGLGASCVGRHGFDVHFDFEMQEVG